MNKFYKFGFVIIFLLGLVKFCFAQTNGDGREKIIGMYVHQHWSYNHPYAARTWTIEDWSLYLDGLKKIGYNSVLIWPLLEIMPNPLTPSDLENIEKIRQVINLAHERYEMKVFIVLCPNVVAIDSLASKYSFSERPYFHVDDRIDPGNPKALSSMIEYRAKLIEPLKEMDGIFIIDSDPGGWANSTNLEFVYLLSAHHEMLKKMNDSIELYYWAHAGWLSYARFYATAKFEVGTQEEIVETISLLKEQKSEPWGVATSIYDYKIGEKTQSGDRMLSFKYGAIEGEPSFPFTRFDYEGAFKSGEAGAVRGSMGNAQTHVVQLPNTFAFAQGAKGESLLHKDFIEFANGLVPEHGDIIVKSWEALQGKDENLMIECSAELQNIYWKKLKNGELSGLIFGNPNRFISDLIKQLNAKASFWKLYNSVFEKKEGRDAILTNLENFIYDIDIWQKTHGYSNNWYWKEMFEVLRFFESTEINAVLDGYSIILADSNIEDPFERVRRGLSWVESFSVRLIDSIKVALKNMRKEQ